MSTIKVDNLQTTGGAGLYPARAWVNFNGTGTVAIRDDANVSSITDNATGDYTVNLTTSLSGANYACTFGSYGITNHPQTSASVKSAPSTTSVRAGWGTTGGASSVGFHNDDAATYAQVVMTL